MLETMAQLRRQYLTRREREILKLMGEGHSAESASAVLGITTQSGKNALQRARDRLGMNTYGLVGMVARQEAQRVQRRSLPTLPPA